MSDIDKLTAYIEENLRSTVNSGMNFIDPKKFKSKLLSKQNHVAFGRRGAGKSSLVSSIKGSDQHIYVYINLEDYKDISFPNIILHVLLSLCKQMLANSLQTSPWYKFRLGAIRQRQRLKKLIKELNTEIKRPDSQDTGVTEKIVSEKTGELGGTNTGISAKTGGRNIKEKQSTTNLSYNKLEELKLTINKYQEFCVSFAKSHDELPIFLILDDLYFLKKEIQPYLIDFFHRLSKGTPLYLKVATIKHRSILYTPEHSSYIGAELGHDIHDIDLDYTLDKFDDMQSFMRNLIEHSISESGSTSLDIDSIFAGESFKQLCLASGGVPRDFLSLFLKVIQSTKQGEKVDKVQVTNAAISSINNKLAGISKDTQDDADTLEKYLLGVKEFVYSLNRTNVFLVAKEDLERFKDFRQALKELVDMRLLHIIDANTSCAPSDGRRYEAYMIDVGLYDNSRPRNFTYIEPGSADNKGRKDKMRAAPKLNVDQFLSFRN